MSKHGTATKLGGGPGLQCRFRDGKACDAPQNHLKSDKRRACLNDVTRLCSRHWRCEPLSTFKHFQPASATTTIIATKGPRLHSKRDRLRPIIARQLLASSRYLGASIRYLLSLPSSLTLSRPRPCRHPRRNGRAEREPKTVIAKETVVKNTITTAYARVDRPVTKALRSCRITRATITRPLSPRSDGAVQQVSAPGGLRDLIRGVEERKAREAERRADSNYKDLYVLADGNEDMGCVKKNAKLMSALRKVRAKYGKAVVVDSAYRSPAYNRRVRGAKGSYHMSCNALDIYVTSVSKDALRAFVRTLPEIGGVGIYASGAIHIDTGPVRNWDWRRKSRKVGAEL